MTYLDKKQKQLFLEDDKRTEALIEALPILKRLHEQTRLYEFDIKLKNRGMIVFSGDWHIAHPNPDDSLMDDLDLIKKHKIPTILMGDLFENYNLISSTKKPSEAMISLPDQKEIIINLVKRIKKNVLGMIIGNHELRSYYTDRYNFTFNVCKDLNLNYLGRWSKLNIINKHPFGVFVAHKWQGRSIYNPNHPCIRARIDQPLLAGTSKVVTIAHNHIKSRQTYHGIHNLRTGCYVNYDDFGDSLGHLPLNAYNGAVTIIYNKDNDGSIRAYDSITEALKDY
jgi:hypothetical protein